MMNFAVNIFKPQLFFAKQFVMENPNTLITRFYGMHRVKMHHLRRQMHFVIMASVFYTPKEIHLRFDLKVGHTFTLPYL